MQISVGCPIEDVQCVGSPGNRRDGPRRAIQAAKVALIGPLSLNREIRGSGGDGSVLLITDVTYFRAIAVVPACSYVGIGDRLDDLVGCSGLEVLNHRIASTSDVASTAGAEIRHDC